MIIKNKEIDGGGGLKKKKKVSKETFLAFGIKCINIFQGT
jgi:hypothetical protein